MFPKVKLLILRLVKADESKWRGYQLKVFETHRLQYNERDAVCPSDYKLLG